MRDATGADGRLQLFLAGCWPVTGSVQVNTERVPSRATQISGPIARVLRPGGTYFSQQVGPASVFELVEYFLGPQPEGVRLARHPEDARRAAEAAGLEVVDLRAESLRTEFFDIGAVIYFLRKVVWMVPGFSVEQYLGRLRELDEEIRREGAFVAHATRFLIEARKPVSGD